MIKCEGRFPLCLQTYPMGRDRVFLITGGQAHIGAVATAYYAKQHIHVELVEVPGHREGPLTRELALQAAETLGQTVTVLIGIHFDGPTKVEIEGIVANARAMMNEKLEQLTKAGDAPGCCMTEPPETC